MKRIHTGFALRFNQRSERHGYLFQGRYGSRIVQDDADLVAVIAYVLRNPLEARLVRSLAELERYPWCSYAALVGRREPFAFEHVAATLASFDPASEVARERLRARVLRAPNVAQPPASPDELIRQVYREHAVGERDLRMRRRARPIRRARAQVCKRAAAELGLGPTAIARALGIAHSAAVQAIRK